TAASATSCCSSSSATSCSVSAYASSAFSSSLSVVISVWKVCSGVTGGAEPPPRDGAMPDPLRLLAGFFPLQADTKALKIRARTKIFLKNLPHGWVLRLSNVLLLGGTGAESNN